MQSKIFYFYDALCGWCYGFSPVIRRLHRHFGQAIDFQVFSGGMVRGDRVGPIGEMAPYIRDACQKVEERTGITFGEPFLKQLDGGNAIFSSLPPAIALLVFRRERPEDTVPFAADLQAAIYRDGMPPTRVQAYGPLVEPFGLDGEAFVEAMTREEHLRAAKQEFEECARLGISGFPTLILHHEGRNFLLARGYVPYDPLARQLEERGLSRSA